jgi:RIO-like serine/threonine protein kinase
MSKLQQGDRVRVCGEEYKLVNRLGGGFQFRTWVVKTTAGKAYVAKVTDKRDRALDELRTYLFLKAKRYPERFYAPMRAFDHEAVILRKGRGRPRKFYAILLKHLPDERFVTLRQAARKLLQPHLRTVMQKLERRVRRLHKLRVSHGDLHANNVLIGIRPSRRVSVRLIDFTHSKFDDRQAQVADTRRLRNHFKRYFQG